jgi:hypothetical protein
LLVVVVAVVNVAVAAVLEVIVRLQVLLYLLELL